MPTEKELLDVFEGVELWETRLVHDGTVDTRAYYLKSLRTPDSPAFSTEAQARQAFNDEVKLSAASEFVQQFLGRT